MTGEKQSHSISSIILAISISLWSHYALSGVTYADFSDEVSPRDTSGV